MKAIVWGCCGSLPRSDSSASIRRKVRDAIWQSRGLEFKNLEAVGRYLNTLPHSASGTYRANTSCVQIDAGLDEFILCDAGTGLREFALQLGDQPKPATFHIFISHLHWDHIQGFPYFRPAYQPGNRIVFHGFHPEIEKTLRQQMRGPCFPIPFEAMKATIEFDIKEVGDSFHIGDVEVSAIQQQHPGISWGYRFEKAGKRIIYSSDSEHGPDANDPEYRFIQFFDQADILIFDGQYTAEEASSAKKHWGHSDHITAVELAARAKVKELVISHHEPNYSDRDIEKLHLEAVSHNRKYNKALSRNKPGEIYPQKIHLAYDGLVIRAKQAKDASIESPQAPGRDSRPKVEVRAITKAEINEKPLISWDGPVEILDSLEAMTGAVEKLMRETHLGFDTETRPTFKKGQYYPPALVQLAARDCVYLFRISKTESLDPLLPILESATILKTGVAIKDDVKELRAMEDFEPAGFVEIADLTLKLGYENRGLRALAALLLNGRISKAAQVSNWARDTLDTKQIRYAATDAWISREIYAKALAETQFGSDPSL